MGGSETPGVQESPLQKAQADVARQQWEDYQKRWIPVQDYFIQRTQQNLPARRMLAEGGANADLQQQFGRAGDQLGASLASRGALTGSNRDIFSRAALANDRGASAGLGRSGVDQAVQRQYESGLQDIVSMGRGQKATADHSLQSLADLGGKEAASAAELAEASQEGKGLALGTLIGSPGGYGLATAFDPK